MRQTHGTVPIDSDLLARFRAALPEIVRSRSPAWHVAWLLKLLLRLAVLSYGLYGLYVLNWSPVVLVTLLVAAVWTAWFCDLLAIWLGSKVWQREVAADGEHAFVLAMHHALRKSKGVISAAATTPSGSVAWAASLTLGGVATICIALFAAISNISFTTALRAEPAALVLLSMVVVSQLASTLRNARAAARPGGMAGLSTGGPVLRLLALWGLIFFCFVVAVNDEAVARTAVGLLYGASVLATLVGLAAMPLLWRETIALREFRVDDLS